MDKTKKNRKAAIALVLTGIILLAAVFLLLKPKDTAENTDGEIKIETDYGDLYYPSRWGQNIKIQQEENTVRFQAEIKGHERQPLFDVHFDSDEGTFFGTVLVNDRAVPVSVTVYTIVPNEDWDQAYTDMLYGMQEDINYLLEKLPLEDPKSAEPQDNNTEQIEYKDIEINTRYGVLNFPGMWEPYLRTNVIESEVCTVEFYANVPGHPEQHLFDISIGANVDGEFQLYSEDGNVYFLEVRYVLSDVDDTWEEADLNILYSMMEGVNHLIEMLDPAAEE